MFNLKAGLLTLPVMAGLAVGAQAATTMTLAPLSPESTHAQIVAAGATCKNPTIPARITAPSVDYPVIAQEIGESGVAGVGITLAASGRAQRVWLVRSSGIPVLDTAAMQSARLSGYSAERENCNAVGGDYLLEVEFPESALRNS